MNIVYICSRFHPYKGGAEENTYQLAVRMVKAGHTVTVLTTDASSDGKRLEPNEVYNGINIIRAKRWNQQQDLGFYPGILWQLLKLKVDIIHYENGPGYIWQEYCLIIKKVFSPSTKIVATPHGPFLATHHHHGLKKLMTFPARVFGFIYFRFIWSWVFNRVFQVSPIQVKWMWRDYWIHPRKIRLVPNGIESGIIVDAKPAIEPNSPVVITTLGRIEKYKGAGLVTEALAQLKAKGVDNFRYVVMGKPDSAYQPILEKQVVDLGLDKHVEFVFSPLDAQRDEILLKESQINVLFSEWEATGIVLLEAMAKGNVVITTDTNQAAELVTDNGQVGYTVPFADIDTLAQTLEMLIRAPEVREERIEKGLEYVKKFTWDGIFPTYLTYLKDLLQ